MSNKFLILGLLMISTHAFAIDLTKHEYVDMATQSVNAALGERGLTVTSIGISWSGWDLALGNGALDYSAINFEVKDASNRIYSGSATLFVQDKSYFCSRNINKKGIIGTAVDMANGMDCSFQSKYLFTGTAKSDGRKIVFGLKNGKDTDFSLKAKD